MANARTDPSAVNEYYSKFWSSESWGGAQPNEDESLRAKAITQFIERFVIPRGTDARNLRILDLGCGRGWLTAILSSYGSVLGIDPVPAAIERGKSLYPTLDIRVAKSTNLISEGLEGQFDLVISSEVIEHVVHSQKPAFLRDIYRLLKPGGFAILTTPRKELWKLWNRHSPANQPVEEWVTEAELQHLCESVNFRVIAKERIFLQDFPFDWLSRIAARNTRTISRFARTDLRSRLRYHRGIYQVILLERGQ